ncbi:MAG TPA: type II toxin-antitoxin system prevent-host-death family antitoxin [Thermoanaerobaculia bacterium]|nr:type II toxin-antitoxin system prevent-host-death family antitoxin [Thermoanaerobaculia bacterium]
MSKRAPKAVSKSRFKAQALEYLREVEKSGKELVITDHGRPVLKVVPYTEDPAAVLESLRGSVLRYDDPLEPVGVEIWETSR